MVSLTVGLWSRKHGVLVTWAEESRQYAPVEITVQRSRRDGPRPSTQVI